MPMRQEEVRNVTLDEVDGQDRVGSPPGSPAKRDDNAVDGVSSMTLKLYIILSLVQLHEGIVITMMFPIFLFQVREFFPTLASCIVVVVVVG